MDEAIIQVKHGSSELSEQTLDLGTQYLRIEINHELPLLLPITDLAELLKISVGQVVPIFQMPAWVVGVYNWRGDMLWVVDFSHFLGLTPWYQQAESMAKHTVVLIQPNQAISYSGELPAVLGLVVSNVADIVTYSEDEIQSNPDTTSLPSNIRPFLQGGCGQEAGQLSWILDSKALLNAITQAHE
ncbi:chemotaxis protein CheW [Nodosilinea sp. LEGE 07088]|uniref:chemotaxis protein CheW n=1 Tax=Nodosilinea sp. LEGE 07088 TaxID=2777968 RepID=UPI001880752E|nr:chemotaxis protein CheW [Nodosilinea sp. LEGE 07088]MBE9139476.1 chemotaxis protein CheW [Nodosilinea sp. LEGE 07088]